jgi:hypothetical protein
MQILQIAIHSSKLIQMENPPINSQAAASVNLNQLSTRDQLSFYFTLHRFDDRMCMDESKLCRGGPHAKALSLSPPSSSCQKGRSISTLGRPFLPLSEKKNYAKRQREGRGRREKEKNFPHKILLHCLWHLLKHWLKNRANVLSTATQRWWWGGREEILDKESHGAI